MKIVVIVRTLNEEINIAEFCEGYSFADSILVADGGSTDSTRNIANLIENVRVRMFSERQYLPNGLFMNPEPAHINFLIDWAIDERADWIILDDCDDWPTPALQRNARAIFEETDESMVFIDRLYIWRETQYLPKCNVSPALWAWNPHKIAIRWPEDGLTLFDVPGPRIDPAKARVLSAPYAGLHHFTRVDKRARYAAWGHPQTRLEGGIYWPPEPLPDWAILTDQARSYDQETHRTNS